MISEVQDHPEASVSSLMGGIVDDFRELVRQELRRCPKDRRRSAEDPRGQSDLGLGHRRPLVAGIAFSLMLANLLHVASTPGIADPAAIPLWGCHGIVGVLLAVAGGILVVLGRKKFESIHFVDNQFDQAVKEISNG